MRNLLACLIGSALISQPAIAAPTKSWGYKPFVVTSQKLGKELSDAYIMENLMCKPTTERVAEYMELVRDYDLLGTESRDGLSSTTFAGRQEGMAASVMFVVDTNTQVLSYVWVNGAPNLACF